MRNTPVFFMATILIMAIVGIIPGFSPAQTNTKSEQGWYGDEAYRFTEWGLVSENDAGKGEDIRRSKACKAALLMAQFKAIEKLADAGIASVSGKVNVAKVKDRILTEVRGFVKGGKVISEDFYSDDNKCKVLYEIREPGLKSKVMAAVRKHAQ